MDTLLDCLRHPIVEISECARLAFKQFFTSYCHKVTKGIERTMVKLFKASTDPNVALARGYTQGLASLNRPILMHFLPKILETVFKNCQKKKKGEDDAETRKYAV